jgi:CrcB protein
MVGIETLLAVGAGAACGAAARYLLSVWIGNWLGQAFPYATLIINMTGSFGLAVFLGWLSTRTDVNPLLRPLVAVGLFGGYTTYSSFANETIALLQAGEILRAGLYVFLTNLLCIIGVIPGLWVGSKL